MGSPIYQAGQSATGQQQWGCLLQGSFAVSSSPGSGQTPNPQFGSVLIIQQARVLHDQHSTCKSHCYSNTLCRKHFLNIIATDISAPQWPFLEEWFLLSIYRCFIYVQSNHFSNRDLLVHSSQDANKHI